LGNLVGKSPPSLQKKMFPMALGRRLVLRENNHSIVTVLYLREMFTIHISCVKCKSMHFTSFESTFGAQQFQGLVLELQTYHAQQKSWIRALF
jgi:hypothetical protein